MMIMRFLTYVVIWWSTMLDAAENWPDLQTLQGM
jgi:hypothetical protein